MPSGLESEWREVVFGEVARQLTAFSGTPWRVGEEWVEGSGTLAVVVRRHESLGDEHVDFGFVLNRSRADAPIIWDCTSGLGPTSRAAIADAVDKWVRLTATVCFELLDQKGRYADHFEPGDAGGLRGWHVIHGPIMGFGRGDGPEQMQRWMLENSLLPQLEASLLAGFDRPELNGIKILFGSDVAEVRINGIRHEEASAALASLDWPRLDPPAFARCFILAIHGVE